jgi:uncharacterized protein DUF4158
MRRMLAEKSPGVVPRFFSQLYSSRNRCTCTVYLTEHVEKESIMSDDLLATRRFKALTDEWSSEELGRLFWPTPEDMLQVRTYRGAANRLGFALNLLLLRFLHCPLPDVTLTPARIVQFVAMQLNVHPDGLAEYSTRASR